MSDKWHVDTSANWVRFSNGEVLTGEQVNNLLDLANPTMQAIILLDITETDEPETWPGKKYPGGER